MQMHKVGVKLLLCEAIEWRLLGRLRHYLHHHLLGRDAHILLLVLTVHHFGVYFSIFWKL
jgi:hypothetical protein